MQRQRAAALFESIQEIRSDLMGSKSKSESDVRAHLMTQECRGTGEARTSR